MSFLLDAFIDPGLDGTGIRTEDLGNRSDLQDTHKSFVDKPIFDLHNRRPKCIFCQELSLMKRDSPLSAINSYVFITNSCQHSGKDPELGSK
jgi:hypothetical protein